MKNLWNKIIEKNNKSFAKMGKARKRVAIARDVIAYLDSNLITPRHGSYLSIEDKKDKILDQLVVDSPDKSLKCLLPDLKQCNVCAKGAIFISVVARKNEV